ncbi:MAG: hypothetical protein WBG94_04275, partial [Anaerolineales bacterium]
MNIRQLLRNGISLKTQKTGWPEDGPLSPAFRELLKTTTAGQYDSNHGQGDGKSPAISSVGADLARIYANRKLRVLFVDTGGSGVAP